MKIFVDADACPVVKETEEVAAKYSVPVVLLCDTNHILQSAYSEVKIISAGADAVDFALVNCCRSGDLVVTQDYGVAAMALGKKARRASSKSHWKGPRKRSVEDNIQYQAKREGLLKKIMEETDG